MIEVVHFKNRFGKSVGVVFMDCTRFVTPVQKEFEQRYAIGLEKPYYPVPALQFAFTSHKMCDATCIWVMRDDHWVLTEILWP